MMFKQLQDMAIFTLVVELGSFTAVAKQIGLPKSSVSQRISQLEKRLGLRLLMRTTRSLSLTFAGERYLVHCQEMMEASAKAQNSLEMLKASPSGRIRMTAPAGLAATLLATVIADFLALYPDVSIEVYVSDVIRDLVTSGYDIALRTGKPKSSSLIGRYLGYAPRYLLASPDYLAKTEEITDPQQLNNHRCIVHKAWTQCVLHRGQERYCWLPPALHMTDNLLYARQSALSAAGITLLPAFLSQEALDNQQLKVILPDWQVEGNELYLVYPSRKLNTPALEHFIEHFMRHPLFTRYRSSSES